MKATAQKSGLIAVAGLVAALTAGAASAKDGFDQLAPGYIGPDGFFEPEERLVINGYGVSEGELPDQVYVDQGDGSLTEFAGQRRGYNPGLIGGILGSAKKAIFTDQ